MTTDKEMRRETARKKARAVNIRNGAIISFLLIGAIIGLYFFFDNAKPQGRDYSVAVAEMDNNKHQSSDDIAKVKYNSNPPTSGPHFAKTAKSGFRDEQIPDGNIIHNLEHGDIWIAYHPSIPAEIKDKLKKFGNSKVIITARDKNDKEIALVAWGRLDKFDLAEVDNKLLKQRIKDFILRHINKAPEQVPGASGGI